MLAPCRAAQELGLRDWTPLKTTLEDMVEWAAGEGLVRHPLASRGVSLRARVRMLWGLAALAVMLVILPVAPSGAIWRWRSISA